MPDLRGVLGIDAQFCICLVETDIVMTRLQDHHHSVAENWKNATMVNPNRIKGATMRGSTKDDLLEFIDYAVGKGLVPKSSARGWRAAANAVVEDIPGEGDVRSLNVETELVKYSNRHPGALSPSTLRRYSGWAAAAIESFARYKDDPINFRPKGGAASKKSSVDRSSGSSNGQRKGGAKVAPRLVNLKSGRQEDQAGSAVASHAPAASGLSMPYPLRSDFRAQLVVPADMTVVEAKRLGAFLLTLAQDYNPE